MMAIPIHRGLALTFFGTGGVYRLEVTEAPVSVVLPPAERPFFCALPGPEVALVAMGEG